ncbi:MAG: transposase [Cellulosilyticum sp.]|nr:transposase [Cellulosilyticum sp.]
MTNYDRSEQLKQLHEQRRAKTEQRVDEAIKRLIKAQKAINFNSVANESGVTKATLYNNQEIKERIEGLRLQQSKVPTPAQVKREMDDNNKDAIIASLKRRIKKLEEENKRLKEQVKISYADIYKQI